MEFYQLINSQNERLLIAGITSEDIDVECYDSKRLKRLLIVG